MANLLETIQKNRQAQIGQPAPMQDQTTAVQGLLRAKSGKGATATDGATSSLAEQSQVDQTQTQLNQLGQQAQVQTQAENIAQAGLKQREQEQRREIDQSRKFNTAQSRIQLNNVLNNLSRQRGQLSLEQKQAGLEQAAFLLAMQDKEYTDTLQDIGRRRRLDNDLAFRAEMDQMVFDQNLDLLKTKLGQGDILAVNDREFAKAMSQMSIDDALKVAEIENAYLEKSAQQGMADYQWQVSSKAKAANEKARWDAIASLGSAGVEAYGTQQRGGFDSGYQDWLDSGNIGSYGKYKKETGPQ